METNVLYLKHRKGGSYMAIEAVTPPVRTRTRESRFSDDEINAALEILDGGSAAKCVAVAVKDQKPRKTKKGRNLTAEDVALNVARSVAHALNRAILNAHKREFSTSSWLDNGNAVGALLPRAPKRRADKSDDKTPAKK